MNVVLNGDHRELPDQATLQWLVDDLGLAGKRLAIEVNEDIVPAASTATFACPRVTGSRLSTPLVVAEPLLLLAYLCADRYPLFTDQFLEGNP